ncbi:Gfo/Idh/MocA family oxidoreductase [Candidatus Pelagibacter sp.]|nr:Gfo/Idh/MocA family oxidoreductase [Candidatus Pelagibacter sp.]
MVNRIIRIGMVGGGKDAFIGGVHRIALRLDGNYELVAGSFSSNFNNSKETGKDLGLAEDRIYETYQEMAEKESARSDGIHVVAIVTPNHLHVPIAKIFAEKGIHIICDKPLALSIEEAIELKNIVENNEIIFALTHNYTGYPMVRHARSLIKKNELGSLRVIQAEYPQDWLTTKVEDSGLKQAEWRTDPKRSGGGGCIGDIGTHAFNLIRFITGLEVDELSADIHTFVKGRLVDDNAQIMLRFKGGAKGTIWSSQVAVGNENNLKIRIFGENGGLEWRQEDPNYLYHTKFGHPTQKITRGSNSASEEANNVTRIPPGHPEGYLEGFANIYSDVYKRLFAQTNNQNYDQSKDCYPTIYDGIEGMEFIETVLESSNNNSKWTPFNFK